MSKKYNRETIIHKLLAKGLKPKPDIKHIEYFLCPNRINIGNKMWGMIDFLKIKIERPKPRERKFDEKPQVRVQRNRLKGIGECFVCKKPVDNQNGIWRLCPNNENIKLHKKACCNIHNLIMSSGLTLTEILKMISEEKGG